MFVDNVVMVLHKQTSREKKCERAQRNSTHVALETRPQSKLNQK